MYTTHFSTRYIRNVVNPRKVHLCLRHTLASALNELATSVSITKFGSGKAANILESTFSHHWETPLPSSSQLRQAERFFLSHPPVFLYSSPTFREVEFGIAPEVAFLGRSNVGKSSLLNALLGEHVCCASVKPGRTKTMNFFAVGGEDQMGYRGKLVVLDMPGYGEGSRKAWWPEIMKYLIGRRQLRRVFLLADAQLGLKSSDQIFLKELRRNGISHQIILSKVDRILLPGPKIPSPARLHKGLIRLDRTYKSVRAKIQPGKSDGPEALGEIISCSALKSLDRGRMPGINQVRWAVLAATGLDIQTNTRQAIRFMKDITRPADDEISPVPSHVSPVRYIPRRPHAKQLAA